MQETGADKRPDIFEYRDFRRYLADLFAFRHRLNPKFNKSLVCKRVGLSNSRSYFQAVLSGRVVSKPKVEEFIRAFELDKDEANFFRILVKFNQSTEFGEEREWYLQQLEAFGGTPRQTHADAETGPFEKWYHPAVFSVLGLKDIRDDFAYLAGLVYPHITPEQAEEAVLSLARMESIRRDERGYWKPVDAL